MKDQTAGLRNRIKQVTAELEASKNIRAMERTRFEHLLNISTVLSTTLNLPLLLEIILDATIKLTHSVAASILLIDPGSGNLYFEAASNIPKAQIARLEVPLEGSIAGWVVQHGQPKVIQQIQDEKEFTVSAKIDSLITFRTHSLLAVPLIVKGKVIGVLEAVNKQRRQPFTQEDEDTLMAVAGQAAVAIENARLFQQSDFISEMVHELRTPLMALLTLSELLTRPYLPAENRQEFAHTIQKEVQRLIKMTSDFLDLSRLESGRVQFKRQPINLPEIIKETITVQRQQAAERGIAIELDLPESLPPLMADGNRIKQAMLNLVSNAIKYNQPDGRVLVSAEAQEGMVQVCVEDSGRGIPPKALENLFERFYRVPDSEGYTTGTGLGLSITQRIIHQHGGTIRVESELGKGSCFLFTLPTGTVK